MDDAFAITIQDGASLDAWLAQLEDSRMLAYHAAALTEQQRRLQIFGAERSDDLPPQYPLLLEEMPDADA